MGLIFVLLAAGLASLEVGRGNGSRVEPLNASAEPETTPPAADGARSGARGAELELRWRRVDDAVFYNVILWRKGARTLDLWPRDAAVDLSTEKLPPGEYRWFVYPALPTERGPRFGRVIAQGTLKV